jgi:hypothetical protein
MTIIFRACGFMTPSVEGNSTPFFNPSTAATCQVKKLLCFAKGADGSWRTGNGLYTTTAAVIHSAATSGDNDIPVPAPDAASAKTTKPTPRVTTVNAPTTAAATAA